MFRLVVQPLWGGVRAQEDMYRQEFQVLVNHHLEGWRKGGEPQGIQVAFFSADSSLFGNGQSLLPRIAYTYQVPGDY